MCSRLSREAGLCLTVLLVAAGCGSYATPAAPTPTAIARETDEILGYHRIVVDQDGNLLPWFSPDLGASYDHVLHLVFEWWLTMPRNPREPDLPYYLMHQVWRPGPEFDSRGLGGDQLAMAMSSWRLYYAYSGDARAIEDMRRIADHVLANGLSGPTDAWPNLPYPYNPTRLDRYSGDMIYGEGYTQPDKAGSLGYELLNLYKMTGEERYLQAAVAIADTLAAKVEPGDLRHSPLPFRVRADTGAPTPGNDFYTTNYAGTLWLFEGLLALGQGNGPAYQRAHDLIVTWLREVPMRTNEWGPFFEDVAGYSNTQINAVTLAMYIMEHGEAWGPDWQADARHLLDWATLLFANDGWRDYGVVVINEQTAYQAPGNSHSARQASMELRYAELTGDRSRVENAIRMLSWATYMVDSDGKNRYLNDDIWLTDGYGDYVRHYLRAMGAEPGLAPGDQDHLLRTTSVVQQVVYEPDRVAYTTFDASGEEVLRITTFPVRHVRVNGRALRRLPDRAALVERGEGWVYNAPGDAPGVLRIRRIGGQRVEIVP
jgi:hypothetical protein